MQLNLIVPVPEGAGWQRGDEKLNGKWWRIKGPLDAAEMDITKFHCVSYVWGSETDRAESFFDCKRDISNRTRSALEAAIRAVDAMDDHIGKQRIEAFWIDAVCVPQMEGPSRHSTLESMGYIYSKAISVVVVLQGAVWEIVRKASASNTALELSLKEMEDLESDTWVSRVWTYQEMVNNENVYFTTFEPSGQQVVVPYEPLLNCVGYSTDGWTKDTGATMEEFLRKFPNLSNLLDTLVDAKLSGYLERYALGVLTNMATRQFDPHLPGNRLLASLGALTQKPSWSPAATLSELAEKLMATCEESNDYSFIFTNDKRDDRAGLGWRPSPHQSDHKSHKPIHLVPVLNWHSYGEPGGNTQRARRDSQGLWLDDMIRLQPSKSLEPIAEKILETWLYGRAKDPANPQEADSISFLGSKEIGKLDLVSALFRAFQIIGFTGSSNCQVCKNGLFFSVVDLKGLQEVELFASGSIRWKFGAPGLAMWKEEGSTRYSAGVFAGDLGKITGQPLLMR